MDPSKFQAVSADFLHFLGDRRETMLAAWGRAVHEFGRLESSELRTTEELRQRLSAMLIELEAFLRANARAFANVAPDQTERDARKRVFSEIRRPAELVPEIAALRMAMIAQLIAYEEHNPDFRGEAKLAVHERVHKFFDDIVASAVRDLWQQEVAGLHAELTSEKKTTAREFESRERAKAEGRATKSEGKSLR